MLESNPARSDSRTPCSFSYGRVPHLSRASCPHTLAHPDHTESQKEAGGLRMTQTQIQSPHIKGHVQSQEGLFRTLG